MQSDAIQPGQTVIIVDDLIATGVLRSFVRGTVLKVPIPSGGSAKAAGELVAKLGGKTLEYLFIIELPFLKGTQLLDAPVYSIIQYDD